MAASMLLYVDSQFSSPYAMSAYVALKEKAQAFELVTVDLSVAARGEAFHGASLTGRVPVLVDGAFALTESSAIAEYLDETLAGTALYPRDAQGRARARQVQAWLRSDLAPLRKERSTEVVFCGRRISAPLSAEARFAADRLIDTAARLLAHGAEHLSQAWSIADADLALMLNRLRLNGDALPQRLADYAERQWHRPSVQDWLHLSRPSLSA